MKQYQSLKNLKRSNIVQQAGEIESQSQAGMSKKIQLIQDKLARQEQLQQTLDEQYQKFCLKIDKKLKDFKIVIEEYLNEFLDKSKLIQQKIDELSEATAENQKDKLERLSVQPRAKQVSESDPAANARSEQPRLEAELLAKFKEIGEAIKEIVNVQKVAETKLHSVAQFKQKTDENINQLFSLCKDSLNLSAYFKQLSEDVSLLKSK